MPGCHFCNVYLNIRLKENIEVNEAFRIFVEMMISMVSRWQRYHYLNLNSSDIFFIFITMEARVN